MHVHVGIDDPDKAIHVANGMRVHLAVLLALSANSPVLARAGDRPDVRADADLPSVPARRRPARVGRLGPLRARGRVHGRSGVMEDPTYLWYDVRPHPALGTVEIRVCDSQTRVEHTLGLTALIQAMVRELAEHHDSGERSPPTLGRCSTRTNGSLPATASTASSSTCRRATASRRGRSRAGSSTACATTRATSARRRARRGRGPPRARQRRGPADRRLRGQPRPARGHGRDRRGDRCLGSLLALLAALALSSPARRSPRRRAPGRGRPRRAGARPRPRLPGPGGRERARRPGDSTTCAARCATRQADLRRDPAAAAGDPDDVVVDVARATGQARDLRGRDRQRLPRRLERRADEHRDRRVARGVRRPPRPTASAPCSRTSSAAPRSPASRARPTRAASGGGNGGGGVPWLLIVIVVGGVGLLAFRSLGRGRRRRAEDQAAFADVRRTAEEDIAAIASDITDLDDDVEAAGAPPAAKQAYMRALDHYQRADADLRRATNVAELRRVAETAADGRYEMAAARAELEGRPVPERRPPCFFDPRHGPSVADVEYAPPGGEPRAVPVCQADAVRLERGEEPDPRSEVIAGRSVPYWSAPGAGYYGGAFGGFGPGLLGGFLLGSPFDAGRGLGAADGTAAATGPRQQRGLRRRRLRRGRRLRRRRLRWRRGLRRRRLLGGRRTPPTGSPRPLSSAVDGQLAGPLRRLQELRLRGQSVHHGVPVLRHAPAQARAEDRARRHGLRAEAQEAEARGAPRGAARRERADVRAGARLAAVGDADARPAVAVRLPAAVGGRARPTSRSPGRSTAEWWRVVTSPFVYGSAWYELAARPRDRHLRLAARAPPRPVRVLGDVLPLRRGRHRADGGDRPEPARPRRQRRRAGAPVRLGRARPPRAGARGGLRRRPARHARHRARAAPDAARGARGERDRGLRRRRRWAALRPRARAQRVDARRHAPRNAARFHFAAGCRVSHDPVPQPSTPRARRWRSVRRRHGVFDELWVPGIHNTRARRRAWRRPPRERVAVSSW